MSYKKTAAERREDKHQESVDMWGIRKKPKQGEPSLVETFTAQQQMAAQMEFAMRFMQMQKGKITG